MRTRLEGREGANLTFSSSLAIESTHRKLSVMFADGSDDDDSSDGNDDGGGDDERRLMRDFKMNVGHRGEDDRVNGHSSNR